jgi:hypothetical protein
MVAGGEKRSTKVLLELTRNCSIDADCTTKGLAVDDNGRTCNAVRDSRASSDMS